jgi:transposase InsO family protein
MFALFCFVLAVLASPFKSKNRLEAENAVLRHQLIMLRRNVQGRVRLTNNDCWFLIQLYLWLPSILQPQPEVGGRTSICRKMRILNVIDEFTRECITIWIARQLKSADVIDVLSDLFILRGIPGHIRSDNGPEFVAKAMRDWITAVGARTAYIMPGSP